MVIYWTLYDVLAAEWWGLHIHSSSARWWSAQRRVTFGKMESNTECSVSVSICPAFTIPTALVVKSRMCHIYDHCYHWRFTAVQDPRMNIDPDTHPARSADCHGCHAFQVSTSTRWSCIHTKTGELALLSKHQCSPYVPALSMKCVVYRPYQALE